MRNQLKSVIILSALNLCFISLTAGYALRTKSLPFENCGSTYDILLVKISSCTNAPCQIPINQKVTVQSDFKADSDILYHDSYTSRNILSHTAYWVLNSVYTRATITPDACDGNICPKKTTTGFTFTAELTVNGTLPVLRGNLLWSVHNESGKSVMCFKVPIALSR